MTLNGQSVRIDHAALVKAAVRTEEAMSKLQCEVCHNADGTVRTRNLPGSADDGKRLCRACHEDVLIERFGKSNE